MVSRLSKGGALPTLVYDGWVLLGRKISMKDGDIKIPSNVPNKHSHAAKVVGLIYKHMLLKL